MASATAAPVTRSTPAPQLKQPITPEFCDKIADLLKAGLVLMADLHEGAMRFNMWYEPTAELYYSRYTFKGHPFVDVHTPILLDMVEEIRDRAPVLFGTLRARLCA